MGTPQRPVQAQAEPAQPPIRPARPSANTDGEEERHWERILAWCRAQPSPEYRNVEVAKAVYPDRFRPGGKARNVIVATVYSATLRRSVGHCRTPDFVLLGRGRFRLATDEERAKARAAWARAKGGTTA